MNYKIVVTMSMFLIAATSAATLNMNDDDYNTLMQLLAEQEQQEQQNTQRDDANAYEENTIDDQVQDGSEVNPEKNLSIDSDVQGGISSGFDLSSAVQTALSFQKPSFSALIGAPTEVLGLVQTFLELKAQVFSKFHALILDNFDVIKNVYRVFSTKLTHIHAFTLKGIYILRKVLEFAVQIFGTWEVNKPSLMVNLGIDKLVNAGVGYNN